MTWLREWWRQWHLRPLARLQTAIIVDLQREMERRLDIEAERDQLRRDLDAVDSLLSGRPALEAMSNRLAKIEKALATARDCDAAQQRCADLESQRKALDAALAESMAETKAALAHAEAAERDLNGLLCEKHRRTIAPLLSCLACAKDAAERRVRELELAAATGRAAKAGQQVTDWRAAREVGLQQSKPRRPRDTLVKLAESGPTKARTASKEMASPKASPASNRQRAAAVPRRPRDTAAPKDFLRSDRLEQAAIVGAKLERAAKRDGKARTMKAVHNHVGETGLHFPNCLACTAERKAKAKRTRPSAAQLALNAATGAYAAKQATKAKAKRKGKK